jgi:hypothetical protein
VLQAPTGDATSSAGTALRRDDARRQRYRKSDDLDHRAGEAADLTRVAERLAEAVAHDRRDRAADRQEERCDQPDDGAPAPRPEGHHGGGRQQDDRARGNRRVVDARDVLDHDPGCGDD